MISAELRDVVRKRSRHRCEYCLLPQAHSAFAHHIEHIVPRQHGGSEDAENLAVARQRCNLHKGPNLTGIDPLTGHITLLFHPRRDRWDAHFLIREVRIEGISAIGRTTVQVLAMNDPRRIELRQELALRREFP